MDAPEIIYIDTHADKVACDGGGGALGHPMVWYSFSGANQIRCGYCDRLFIKQAPVLQEKAADSTTTS